MLITLPNNENIPGWKIAYSYVFSSDKLKNHYKKFRLDLLVNIINDIITATVNFCYDGYRVSWSIYMIKNCNIIMSRKFVNSSRNIS